MFFTIGRIAAVIILIWVMIRTVSYGRWTWMNHSKMGGFAIVLLGVTALILPAYIMLRPA